MCDSQVNFDHMGIFNKKKADLDGFDLELIKAEFRQLFQDNASLFFKDPDKGGLGVAKMRQLFGSRNVNQFKLMTAQLDNNPIYDFIELQ